MRKIVPFLKIKSGTLQTVTGHATAALSARAHGLLKVGLLGKTGTNIGTNGNFVNTTGWSGAGGALSVSGGKATVTGNGSAASIILVPTATGVRASVGDKIYMRARVRASAIPTEGRFQIFNGVATTLGFANIPVSTTETTVSLIHTMTLANPDFRVGTRIYYADAATANGKLLETSELIPINLTALGLADKTAAQIDAMFPYWFDGTKNVLATQRVTSVGVNLLKYNGSLPHTANGVTIAHNNGVYSVVGTSDGYPYKSICTIPANALASGTYRITRTDIKGIMATSGVRVIDRTVSPAVVLANPFTISGGHNTLQIEIACNINVTYDNTFTVQLERGTVATAYQAYRESISYISHKSGGVPVELRQLPNGERDRVYWDGDALKAEQVVSGNYALQAADMLSLYTSWVNIDAVILTNNVLTGILNPAVDDPVATKITTTRSAPLNGATKNDAGSVWKHYLSPGSWGVIVPKGTYADLAAARTALAGTIINYQLATPIVTTPLVAGTLYAYPSGTVHQEQYIADAGVYASGINITDTAFPIKTIESISKINYTTGEETSIDVATAVIAGNKLSFTHASLTDGDIVFFVYEYDLEGLPAEMQLTYYDARYPV